MITVCSERSPRTTRKTVSCAATTGARGLLEPCLHAPMIDDPRMLRERRAILEHDEVGNATNVVALRELGLPLGVDQ